MEKHLTEQCLIIILLKKQMDGQDWPHLQKAEAVPHYIGTDFKQWSWEGDDIISASIKIHLLGTSNEQQVMIFAIGVKVLCLLIEKRQRSTTTVEYFS